MKILITGGRDFADRESLFAELNRLHATHPITLLIHGDARGADRLGDEWAKKHEIEVLACPSDWRRHRGGAGMVRNKQMLEYEPDLLVACTGGRGTQNMIKLAEDAGIEVVRVAAVDKVNEGIVVGFTGTQRGMNDEQTECVREALASFRRVAAAHHGDCIGADAEFHSICIELGIPVHIHPPTNSAKRAFCEGAVSIDPEKDYLDRNRNIVDASKVIIAAPSGPDEKRRSGTWATVRYARKSGKRVFIMLPDGDIAIEDTDG